MGRQFDGGDPGTIEAGSTQLTTAAKGVDGTSAGFHQAGKSAAGGVGDPAIASALRRYTAAATAMTSALHTQLDAAGQLAKNAAADLNTVGGH